MEEQEIISSDWPHRKRKKPENLRYTILLCVKCTFASEMSYVDGNIYNGQIENRAKKVFHPLQN